MEASVQARRPPARGWLMRSVSKLLDQWEYWAIPILAAMGITVILWFVSHNQALVLQSKVDQASLQQVDKLNQHVTELQDEVKRTRKEVERLKK